MFLSKEGCIGGPVLPEKDSSLSIKEVNYFCKSNREIFLIYTNEEHEALTKKHCVYSKLTNYKEKIPLEKNLNITCGVKYFILLACSNTIKNSFLIRLKNLLLSTHPGTNGYLLRIGTTFNGIASTQKLLLWIWREEGYQVV